MTWEYALIGLVVGIVIGAVAMRFGNRNFASSRCCKTSSKKVKTSWSNIAKNW